MLAPLAVAAVGLHLADDIFSISEVPSGQHIAGITTRPQEYERRVLAFFDRELLGKGATS